MAQKNLTTHEKVIGRGKRWLSSVRIVSQVIDISRVSNIESDNFQNVGLEDYNNSRASNIAFLLD